MIDPMAKYLVAEMTLDGKFTRFDQLGNTITPQPMDFYPDPPEGPIVQIEEWPQVGRTWFVQASRLLRGTENDLLIEEDKARRNIDGIPSIFE